MAQSNAKMKKPGSSVSDSAQQKLDEAYNRAKYMGIRAPNPNALPPGAVTPRRSAPSDDLSGRIFGTGMIQPGAKPQYGAPTPLEKTVAGFKKIAAKLKKPKPKP